MKKQIRIHGIKRSGNHAVINWLGKQLDKNFDIKESIPELHNRWDKKQHILFSNDVLRPRQERDYYLNPQKYQIVNSNIWIYNIEDGLIKESIKKIKSLTNICPFNIEDAIDIIVLRDPFNLFASRNKNGGPLMRVSCPKSIKNFSRLWKSHANEFVRNTNFLKSPITISFNEWYLSKDYRSLICKHLDIPFSDEGIDDVTFFGGGSSFSRRKYHGRAREMDVLKRYLNFKHFPFIDEEIIELNKKLFPKINLQKWFL